MVENKQHRSHIIKVLSWFLTTAHTDHPKAIWTTQPSTIGGPLGDPGFRTLLWTALQGALYDCRIYRNSLFVQYWSSSFHIQHLNTLRPRRNEQHFANDIFKRIFFIENVGISIKISLKFVPKGPINNIPALVQIMAWRRPGDKPLSESIMVSLLTHICVTRPQWVNSPQPSDRHRENFWTFTGPEDR